MGKRIFVTHYIQQFKELAEGGSWSDASFNYTLSDLSFEEATTSLQPSSPSILAFLHHINYWRDALIVKLEGDWELRFSPEDAGNWPDFSEAIAQDWEDEKALFQGGHERIIAALQACDDEYLQQLISTHPKPQSIDFIIRGVLHHDVYHLGQMAYIKRSLRNQTS